MDGAHRCLLPAQGRTRNEFGDVRSRLAAYARVLLRAGQWRGRAPTSGERMMAAISRNFGLRRAWRSRALMGLAAFAITTAHAEAPEPRVDQVTFQSATYVDFRQLQSRPAPAVTVTVPATL